MVVRSKTKVTLEQKGHTDSKQQLKRQLILPYLLDKKVCQYWQNIDFFSKIVRAPGGVLQ